MTSMTNDASQKAEKERSFTSLRHMKLNRKTTKHEEDYNVSSGTPSVCGNCINTRVRMRQKAYK